MRTLNISFAIIFASMSIMPVLSQGTSHFPSDRKGDYLGYPKPGSIPEVFAPGFVSTQYAEFAGTFSPDFKEYYFTRRGPFPQGIAQIMVTKMEGDSWSEPEVAVFSSDYYEFEPFITPDGEKLYFGSRRSPDGIAPPGQMHQWYLEKVNSAWSDPVLLGSPFFERMVMYPSISYDHSLYFTDLDGIYCSEYVDGNYQDPVKLGPEINFLPLTAHSYIAPDESYLIFDGQPRGKGMSDIYISYKKQDGHWTKGKYMGKDINSGESQAIASVSPNGECLFFTRNQDIYWMDAAIIEKIKLIPEMSFSPDSGTVPFDVQFSLDLTTVPDELTAFEWDFDNDGNVDSQDQNPQHTYMQTGIFTVSLKVFTKENTATTIFKDIIQVKEDTSGFGMIDRPGKYSPHKLFQNFPNPFQDNTSIRYSIDEETNVKIRVFKINGSEIETLVEGCHKPGSYVCSFSADNLNDGPYLCKMTTDKTTYTKVMVKK